MFPDLPAATFDDDRLLALGVEGSICDGGACDEDSHVEAGQPFFGQYLAHDLTADRSPLRVHGNIEALRTFARRARISRRCTAAARSARPTSTIRRIRPSCSSGPMAAMCRATNRASR